MHHYQTTRSFTIAKCRQYWAGLLTLDELRSLLDERNIRGGFDYDKFTGYDYNGQEWIEVYNPNNQSL